MSGKKDNFDVSPVINPGSSDNITIKQNSDKKFMFGPFSARDLNQEKDQVNVNLFDAQKAVNVTKIKIWRTAGKFEASMFLTDEADPQPMESSGSKHFREKERISKKDWFGWILPQAIPAASGVFRAILNAATGAPA